MSPAPSRRHQGIVVSLNYVFKVFLQTKGCKYYPAPFDVRLEIPYGKKNHTVVQPDLCVICDIAILDDAGCNGTPDLMIEILSPNNQKQDLDTKFKLYEEGLVKEYWIVDPMNKSVFIYTLRDGEFIGLRPFAEGNSIESPLFPDLSLDVDTVFEDLD